MSRYMIPTGNGSPTKVGSDYGWWAMSRIGKGVHHLCEDRGSHVTRCGKKITAPNWFKIRRESWRPFGKTRAEQRKRTCKQCEPLK